jgi:DNA end-binding protein Ku
MPPPSLWSGNIRLSLVPIPVRLVPAISTEEAISFRQIHEPSGEPIRYVKGIETEKGFKEVPEDEIVKGYEYAKGHYVLLHPEEIDELKLEAKHTIDMRQFVDENEIDSRYWEVFTSFQMVTRLTKAMPSWQGRWRKPARSPSVNSSDRATNTS